LPNSRGYTSMRRSLWPVVVLSLISLLFSLTACEKQQPETQPDAQGQPPAPVADIAAGKAIADQSCAQCHGADGATSRDGAPFLAGQQTDYMVTALQDYKDSVRKDNQHHESLQSMSDADYLNVAAYYNSLDTAWNPERYKQKPKPTGGVSRKAIQAGKQESTPCVGCHGEDGNSQFPGIPTIAGLQYDYIKSSIKAYFNGDRKESKVIMQNFKNSIKQRDIANLAAYYSTRKPQRSPLPSSGSVKAGKKAASEQCAGCHGVDGNSINPTMPSLTGQNQEYLIKAINAYRKGKRQNPMMRAAVKTLNNKSIQNISAYFAAQQPKKVVGQDSSSGPFDPLGDGAKIAASCNSCHGKNGNSTRKGIPRLAGLHPMYLQAAIKAYREGVRKNATMQSLVSLLSAMDIEKISLYYATQEPVASGNGKPKNPEQAMSCNGCHGDNGNSTDTEVPSIAGQDAKYIAAAIGAYAGGARENETMNNAVKELSKEQIQDVSAYFSEQTPVKPQDIEMPLPPEELALKCNRCHGENGFSEDPSKPRLAGQIQAYLEKALHDYHDGDRESTTMHAMAAVLRLSEIKAISTYYSQQEKSQQEKSQQQMSNQDMSDQNASNETSPKAD
jgi:cytochrome c553